MKMDKSLNQQVKIKPLTLDERNGEKPVIRHITISETYESTIFHDYLTTASVKYQYHIISDRLKLLISLYLLNYDWTPVVLIDQFDKGYLYWFLEPININCISSKTSFNHDRTLKELIIDKQNIGKNPVFQVNTQIQKANIVRLDLAESMLRRGFLGIDFIKVGVEE